jgi:hypothetical protein
MITWAKGVDVRGQWLNEELKMQNVERGSASTFIHSVFVILNFALVL